MVFEVHAGGAGFDHGLHQLERVQIAAESGFGIGHDRGEPMNAVLALGVMDLIRAQTDLAMQAATEQLEGRLGAKIRELREQLLAMLAHVEAFIDFPDEDIDPDTGAALLKKLEAVREEIEAGERPEFAFVN